MSKTFRPWEIDEPLLLPPVVQEFVAKDHLARLVLSLVRDLGGGTPLRLPPSRASGRIARRLEPRDRPNPSQPTEGDDPRWCLGCSVS
jgi:hypothetical protein